jgi:transcriptional regulator with XRE-family HTH domain
VAELQNQLVEALRRVAEEQRVVLSHLPDRAGVSRSHFWDVLKGRKSPTLEWVEKVATSLEVRPEILLHRHGAGRSADVIVAAEGLRAKRTHR